MRNKKFDVTVNNLLERIEKIDNESYVAYFHLPRIQESFAIGFKIDGKDFEDETITLVKPDGSTPRVHRDENNADSILIANPIIRYMKKRGYYKNSPQNLPPNIRTKVDRIINTYTNSCDEDSPNITYLLNIDGEVIAFPHQCETDTERDKFIKNIKKKFNLPEYVCCVSFLQAQANKKDILLIDVETIDFKNLKILKYVRGVLSETDEYEVLNLSGGSYFD